MMNEKGNKMKQNIFFIYLLALVFLASSACATQVLVVNDSVEKIYGIENMKLSGSVPDNLLRMTGSGEVISGEGVKVYLIGPSDEVLVKNLLVNGAGKAVSFDYGGYFFIAEKGPFTFSADLEIKTLGQIKLYVKGPVNRLTFDLKDGYAIGGDIFGAYGKDVIIQRSSAQEPEDQKNQTLIDGIFRYTYGQERNEFIYDIKFTSFGTSLGRYEFDLPDGESIISVYGALKWEQKGQRLILDLESQKAEVTISGIFDGSLRTLEIPNLPGRHYVLIESDPEKRLSILKTTAEEIDLSQARLTPKYSNARAFLASPKDIFEITVEDLTVLPSLSAAVSSAQNIIAITSKGSILGELTYNYANTGLDYLTIDSKGTPLYAATDRGTAKLTKDKDKLLLSLPKGEYKTLDYVYFSTRNPLNPIDLVDVPIAKTDIPITTAYTTIYLPADYYVLGTFGAQGGSEIPPIETLIIFFAVIGIASYALYQSKRFMILYAIAAIGLAVCNPLLFILLIIVSILVVAKRYVHKNTSIVAMLAGGVLLVLLLAAVFIGLTFVWQMGTQSTMQRGPYDNPGYSANYAQVSESSSDNIIHNYKSIGGGEGSITVPTREGVLPVKLDIPALGKTVSLTSYLVTKENPLSIKVLIIAEWFKYVLYLISACAFVSAYRTYQKK
jgi:hypothetical protein